MTNGEKLKEIFPSIELYEKSHDAIQINFDSDWWNAEYKEPTTKNDKVDCEHTDCNNCVNHKYCDYEPTTKNDLGVDREDAVERLNALKQLIGYDKDSEIVKATQKSLDMAIKALEQETVSKESYDHEYFLRKEFEIKIARLEHDKNAVLDKIRAEIEELDYITFDGITKKKCLEIIDRYMAETEET